jgi:hypothetical protein
MVVSALLGSETIVEKETNYDNNHESEFIYKKSNCKLLIDKLYVDYINNISQWYELLKRRKLQVILILEFQWRVEAYSYHRCTYQKNRRKAAKFFSFTSQSRAPAQKALDKK